MESYSKLQINLRITALWATSEAFLGGMLHAFQVPFTGLVLSAFAAVCMTAMALYGHQKGEILKATILVIIIKAMLSPHTPPAAYFAVFLQGLAGELIFSAPFPFRISSVLVSVFVLVESAFQKLIILTVLFGAGFWKSLDQFVQGISKEFGRNITEVSLYLVCTYITLHIITGIIVGIFAGRFPIWLKKSEAEFASQVFVIPDSSETETSYVQKKKSKFTNPFFWIIFLLICFLIYELYWNKGQAYFFNTKAMYLILRAALIILVWYFFAAPLLMNWLKKWLARQRNRFSSEIKNLLLLIPEMKYITEQCWKRSGGTGLIRINRFIRFTFFMILKTDK